MHFQGKRLLSKNVSMSFSPFIALPSIYQAELPSFGYVYPWRWAGCILATRICADNRMDIDFQNASWTSWGNMQHMSIILHTWLVIVDQKNYATIHVHACMQIYIDEHLCRALGVQE